MGSAPLADGVTTPALLACPECSGRLDGETTLRCEGCGREYPVRDGVPRLAPRSLGEQQRRTATAFGWEWRVFAEQHAEYEREFSGWVRPLDRSSFAGKAVLDAGCGTGRHARVAARWGAAPLVALDLSDAVDTARRVLAETDALVVQGDLLRPPLRRGSFDVVYSIGVVHHLPSPAEGIAVLASLLRPGGTLFVWVYGHEGNEFVRLLVEPLRRLTSRLPARLVYRFALPAAAAVFAASRVAARSATARRLPLGPYLASLAGFGFRHIWLIVFDQLVAPTTRYVRREELERWLRDAGLDGVQTSRRNENSWRGWGRRPEVPH